MKFVLNTSNTFYLKHHIVLFLYEDYFIHHEKINFFNKIVQFGNYLYMEVNRSFRQTNTPVVTDL